MYCASGGRVRNVACFMWTRSADTTIKEQSLVEIHTCLWILQQTKLSIPHGTKQKLSKHKTKNFFQIFCERIFMHTQRSVNHAFNTINQNIANKEYNDFELHIQTSKMELQLQSWYKKNKLLTKAQRISILGVLLEKRWMNLAGKYAYWCFESIGKRNVNATNCKTRTGR